jgi:hypothetical protein
MRSSLAFSFLASVAVAVACGSNPPAAPEGSSEPPPADTDQATETPAPESSETPPAASTEAPAASTTPTTPPPPPPLTPEEEAAWKKSAAKLDESAKKAGKACGTTLNVHLPIDRWTGKVLAASGPDALAGGGLPVCTAGLDAMGDVCKKDAKLKTTFAGWIKQYRCWPAAGPSVGTADDAFELAFSLPGRTPADYKKMVTEALEGSLKAAATK